MKYSTCTKIAKFLLLLIAVLIAMLLNSCVTYKACKTKFGSNYTDTTYVTKQVIVSVPKDSINTVYRNDTNFVKVVETARTILKIQKEPTYTYITCQSKEIIKTLTVKAPCPPVPQNWGVSPYYRTGVFVLSGALLLALICITILFLIKRNNFTLFGK